MKPYGDYIYNLFIDNEILNVSLYTLKSSKTKHIKKNSCVVY